MSKANQKISIGCRVLDSTVLEIDAAALAAGMNRAEWIENAIARQLNRRPRRTLLSRLAKVEQELSEVRSRLADAESR